MEADDNNMSLRVASFSCYLDTAKESLVRRVSAQDPSTIKQPINIKFSKKDHAQDHHHHHHGLTNLRVDSFNSYLNTAADHNFVFEVPGPIQDPTSAFTFSHEIPKDGEIGVFGADKYFNMKLEYQTGTKIAYKNEAPPKTMPRTPSLSSETTTWNSQKALIPNFQPNESKMKQKKAMARRLFMGFGCRGPCFNKKSVHNDEIGYYTSKPTRTGTGTGSDPVRLIHHHPPLAPLAPPPPPPPPPIHDQLDNLDLAAAKIMKMEELDESRPSIEVFGSSLNRSSKGDVVATNMERKLSMLTWDAIPKGRNLPTSTIGTSTIIDDMASDASSDLFEIENISGSIYPLLPSELGGDDMSSCMSPTTSLYAPSEASIQWSVVTAPSAADYSVLSEFNDESVSVAGDKKNIVAKRGLKMRNHEVQRTKASGFLGCKSHKAVDVAENVGVKSNDKAKIVQGGLHE